MGARTSTVAIPAAAAVVMAAATAICRLRRRTRVVANAGGSAAAAPVSVDWPFLGPFQAHLWASRATTELLPTAHYRQCPTHCPATYKPVSAPRQRRLLDHGPCGG